MQFYRGMEIGTAAPTPAELAQVKHHFVSFLEPDETMTAGQYELQGRKVVSAINADGKPAVVVGGSGLYINALIDGLFEGPGRDQSIRDRLIAEATEQGNGILMDRLQEVDPAYASTIQHVNDQVRLVRALEVYEITGRPFSELHEEHRAQAEPIEAIHFGLNWDRAKLYERINRRVDQMVKAGWVEEVQALLDKGYGPQIQRLKALGFREIAASLRGEQSLEVALEATKMHHRRYAKRQLTWFRGDGRVQWLEVEDSTSIEALLRAVLSTPALKE